MTQPYGQQPGGNQPGSGGFQQPAFPQAPQAAGAGSYQQGYGGMPQAPQEYSGGSQGRPGVVTAAAVLAFVQAGLTAITTILVFSGVADMEGSAALFQVLIGLAQTAGVVLLIVGGVQLMGGKGRGMMLAGCIVELVICLFYLVVFAVIFGTLDDAGIDVLGSAKAVVIASAVFFAIMPSISLVLSFGQQSTQFLRSRG